MPSTIANLTYPKKPPKYWVAEKRRLGIADAGMGRIWYTIYRDEKRLLAWLAAPQEEWLEHGLRKPE
jgi:hypothetical protein